MKLTITTGNYNTESFKVLREYTSERPAIKYLKSIGYIFDSFQNYTWSNRGTQYKLNVEI